MTTLIPPAQLITVEQLTKIAGPVPARKRKKQLENIERTAFCLNTFGSAFELDAPVVLARFIGQICIESDRFCTTVEYASGAAYEGRKDLGNVQPGDGRKYRGHGLIQTTGRANTSKFSRWASTALKPLIEGDIPDFVKHPRTISVFPYAFFSAAYYWTKGNPTGKSLNRFCFENNDEMLTRRINGGLNHFSQRLEATADAALVLLGYEPTKAGIRKFQTNAKASGYKNMIVDGLMGKQTRDALHVALIEKRIDEVIDEIKVEEPEEVELVPGPKPEPSVTVPPLPAPLEPAKEGFIAALLKAIFGPRNA